MRLLYRLWKNETSERLAIWLAYHLPKRIAYWAFIRVSTANNYGAPYPGNPGDRTVFDAAQSFWKPI